jgi:radial spoke head protein 3
MAASASATGPLAPGSNAANTQQRPLYRDQSGAKQAKPLMNMMSDRRIVRGNTYAAPVVPPSMAQEIERKAKEDEERQRRRRALQQSGGAENRRGGMTMGGRPYTPEPVPGRSHAELQTETFLEVISDRPPEFEMGVQTEALQDRPPTPLFVPRPSGVDKDTQILEGELFDFDLEVSPVLEVLVGE